MRAGRPLMGARLHQDLSFPGETPLTMNSQPNTRVQVLGRHSFSSFTP